LLVCEPIQADVEEVQLLSDGIESMVGHLKRLIERNTEQEKQRRRTDLRYCRRRSTRIFYITRWIPSSG
jgi:sensor histidine kinase YesM